MPEQIPFYSLEHQHVPMRAEMLKSIEKVVDANWFVMGSALSEFEKKYAAFNNTSFCAGVANGLDAIYLSLRALDIGKGDEVIVPSYTYIATWLAVSMSGATIIPVEPDPLTYNIDHHKIEKVITKKTKAIIPVHLYGQACRMQEIMAIVVRHGLSVIEDNAQAHGAACGEKKTGSFGHCNATSFYPTKNLGALGDGGAVTTDNRALYEKVLKLRNYGSSTKYHHEIIGINSRLDELQAAILECKLGHLGKWTEDRQRIAAHYGEELQEVGDLILPVTAKECSHVYHLYVVRTKRRDQLQQYLTGKGIQTLIHYPLPPHLQSAYASLRFSKGAFPIAEELADTSLSLPLWPGMERSMLATVVNAIKSFYERP